MKKKLTTLLFGLLLAVGWTSDAQAQQLPKRMVDTNVTSVGKMSFMKEGIGRPAAIWQLSNEMNRGQQFRAPQRSQNFSSTSPVTHPKSWYEQDLPNPYVTWNGGSQLITQPFTTVDGMMALVERVYRDQNIPGAKYSDSEQCDIPYQTIHHGWNIIGNIYEDVTITTNNQYCDIYGVYLYDGNGDLIKKWDAYEDGTTLPAEWPTTGNWVGNSQGYTYFSSGGTITIPGSELQNSTGYAYVIAQVFNRSSWYSTSITVGNDTWGHNTLSVTETQSLEACGILNVGNITPPDDPGYTILLVKLKDEFNLNVPEYTYTTDSLRDYFTEYIKEIQLLTDGLRVNQNTDDAGTLFAYTGDLNKFYFIGKGKMYFTRSLNIDSLDRAPFNSMYEEFSPYVSGGSEDHSDLYEKMKQGQTYPVVHDCEGVIFMKHWFTIASEDGSSENRVNSLVFYVPDKRGKANNGQTYDPEHQPTVGMYMVDLFADITASTTPGYYSTMVTWEDNLDAVTHSEGIPQIYTLYEVIYNEETGKNDTTQIYQGPNNYWNSADDPEHGDYAAGNPNAYDIHYFVVATPRDATNPETFYAQSSPDDVTVPGVNDFIGLQWWRYESDYVTKDTKNTEVNYYRNWLAPHKLSVQDQSGICAGNVGTTGRTLTLYRDETPVIDLELVMNGNKAYYRIKYRDASNQEIEPGYGSDGEVDPNYNPNNN